MISLPILLYSMSTLFEKKASPLPPSLVNTSTVTLLHGQQPSACLSQTLVEHRVGWCWQLLEQHVRCFPNTPNKLKSTMLHVNVPNVCTGHKTFHGRFLYHFLLTDLTLFSFFVRCWDIGRGNCKCIFRGWVNMDLSDYNLSVSVSINNLRMSFSYAGDLTVDIFFVLLV